MLTTFSLIHFFPGLKQNLLEDSKSYGVGVGLDGVPHWRLLWDVHLGNSFWGHALHLTEVYKVHRAQGQILESRECFCWSHFPRFYEHLDLLITPLPN